MEQVVFLIGGNLDDRIKLILEAEKQLSKTFKITGRSSVYETPAWGKESNNDYLNRALVVESSLDPMEILLAAQNVENILGRERKEKWGDRTMDIDIIYIGQRVIDTPKLKVPHPLMTERKFVLEPLVEVLPNFLHPVLGQTSKELLETCPDKTEPKRYMGKGSD
ncbi:2-amino-4-hydroxy-6-hydroxymethyldihydropteridine diphosphokinase [Echinicola jeungdonensis]|uniref:2-amino-4-hydroxy-6-hydroxymethyldihydropteridine pyrophosphokinase n=1 Tax=Echinicola jeungdonensis TaxID=709343 RepID=A0ABV5J2V9_9BACT|nr:2-amino-4-hydroxy-6-hydroxymethyldihydropteridine diphosphokinase [Echinicola jeungdonensis]MDN3667999.1 2-amino-4-hydroxy-6-hydroxymethyldihydropteridine diphosphokinase [Echinicola jeungdonensis]